MRLSLCTSSGRGVKSKGPAPLKAPGLSESRWPTPRPSDDLPGAQVARQQSLVSRADESQCRITSLARERPSPDRSVRGRKSIHPGAPHVGGQSSSTVAAFSCASPEIRPPSERVMRCIAET